MTLTVRAPAKINLHLGVGAPREDGFHPLATVYQAVGLYDDLTVVDADGWSVDVAVSDWMDRGQVPLGGDNIVDRAAALLAAHHGLEVRGTAHVDKSIPVAGGMAGGSADAAAALVALDRLWDAGTTDDDLLELAARLGSDVPFALIGGSALGTGRGELVERVADHGSWWWVLVPSPTGLSTPEVYRHFDRLRPDAPAVPPVPEALLDALDAGVPHALAATLHNDLQEAALDLRPDLGRLIEAGESEGALRGMVSGSGPTCVFLCEDPDAARAVAGGLQEQYDVVLVAGGAVAGAHTVTYG
ncbi:4-(cytidine 5'-diphospho)-2-C-methyl-D-erythritol kinase [Nocardioides mangrovi]|uniref:4-diphosphocytidyl-2-C-methyl-D-erythritol kinase n=1 Tax=Nocardioides mangrovi TaxID=2874580 RepID=A0ABS7U9U7_9ACTN|nr:4-(cytidine 5'-diphospho)-2-C-methyl-D-erythritol kinase [Nocardioides mangrovi]MBZ5737755.1 4-(cytidine 5'-diphospho)-2-C-methyl-D-erythritol kinase [Nocardioides mangrovi]